MKICLQRKKNLVTILLIVWLLTGCAGLPAETTDTDIPPTDASGPIIVTNSAPSTPITGKLILSKAPRLEEPAELTFIFSSVADAPGSTAEILLPEGADLVDGKLVWTGDLAADQPVQIQATIKFVKEGNWTIEAKARHELESGDVWGDALYIYLHVTEDAGQVGFSTQSRDESSEQEKPTPPAVEPQP